MRKIVDYIIVEHQYYGDMNVGVGGFLNDGYELYGNPFATETTGQMFQAVVKYEDQPDIRNQTIQECKAVFENSIHTEWKTDEIVETLQALIKE